MIIKKTYTFNITGIEHDIIHLFEHLVLHAFVKYLNNNGFTRSLVGWINGQTIDNYLIFDLGVYAPRVLELFEYHLLHLDVFSHNEIVNSLHHIEAELAEVSSIRNFADLDHQLQYLSLVVKGNAVESYKPQSTIPVVFHKKPGKFRTTEILIKATSSNVDHQILFLGFHQVIIDILRANLENTPAYPINLSPIIKHGDTIGIVWQLSINSDLDVANLIKSLRVAVKSFDAKQYKEQINTYFDSYLHDDVFNNVTNDYQEQTGIHTTSGAVAKAATIENITKLLNKVEVETISPTKNERLALGLPLY